VASGSTTVLNYLELLGVSSTLKVLDMNYVTSPCLMRLAECGAIAHVSAYNTDAWLAATSAVELVLTDSWGTGSTGTGRDVDVDASFDPGILNRGEWIKFLSLFFNAEATANAYFASMTTNITAQDAAGTAAAVVAGREPVVAFAAYVFAYETEDYGPVPATWQLSNATYKAQYVDAAGGVLAAMPAPGGAVTYTAWTSPATTANFDNAAALRSALVGVDVLIEETVVWPQSPETYTFAAFLDTFGFTPADVASGAYPFLTNRAIWRTDKTINDGTYGGFGTDWFANSISQPHAVLLDFQAALFPGSAAMSGHVTTWLRNLAANEPVTVRESAQCMDPTIAPVCGGPSLSLTLPNLAPAAFSAAALQKAVLEALPAGATAAVAVTDFAIATTLVLSAADYSASTAAFADVTGFLGALGRQVGHPITAVAPLRITTGRRLQAAATASLSVSIDSFGMAGAPAAAAMLALLANSTALLTAVQAAGGSAATGASAAGTTVSASVTVTVKGANAAAGAAALQAAVDTGALDRALVTAGIANEAPTTSAAPRSVATRVLLTAAALAAVALLA
jgi:hypothetical protein